MSTRSRRTQSALAGVGVLLATMWPILAIWWAGASGSLGDLSQIQTVAPGFAYGLILAALAAGLMSRALRWVDGHPSRVPGDAWGAYALALGVYSLALTLVPIPLYLLLLGDEGQSLADRFWLIATMWVGGNLLATAAGVGAGRRLLVGRRKPQGRVACRGPANP